jgi:predicted transcriptional regulator
MGRTRTIEVDTLTADELEARAAQSGVSVGEVVSQLVALDRTSSADLAGLEAQWMTIERGEKTVPLDKVAGWLDTWGTPAFKPWPGA